MIYMLILINHVNPVKCAADPSFLGSCRLDNSLDSRNVIRRKSAETRVLLDHLLIRRDVDAIKLVVGHIALNPLNLRSQFIHHAT